MLLRRCGWSPTPGISPGPRRTGGVPGVQHAAGYEIRRRDDPADPVPKASNEDAVGSSNLEIRRLFADLREVP